LFSTSMRSAGTENSAVDVHYEPTNPSNAVLQVTSSTSWLLLMLALFWFGVAVHVSGILRHW
jgi:hypothetical protein